MVERGSGLARSANPLCPSSWRDGPAWHRARVKTGWLTRAAGPNPEGIGWLASRKAPELSATAQVNQRDGPDPVRSGWLAS